MIGIGDKNSNISVYIGNRPPMDEYINRAALVCAGEGDLARIAKETGNHWRKIINIYAKLCFSLAVSEYPTWQRYRDEYLLREGSHQSLLFDCKIMAFDTHCVSLLCGKAHAATLIGSDELHWVDDDFAVNEKKKVVVTPYFDYRQLSNVKIEKLVSIIHSLNADKKAS